MHVMRNRNFGPNFAHDSYSRRKGLWLECVCSCCVGIARPWPPSFVHRHLVAAPAWGRAQARRPGAPARQPPPQLVKACQGASRERPADEQMRARLGVMPGRAQGRKAQTQASRAHQWRRGVSGGSDREDGSGPGGSGSCDVTAGAAGAAGTAPEVSAGGVRQLRVQGVHRILGGQLLRIAARVAGRTAAALGHQ